MQNLARVSVYTWMSECVRNRLRKKEKTLLVVFRYVVEKTLNKPATAVRFEIVREQRAKEIRNERNNSVSDPHRQRYVHRYKSGWQHH